MKPSDAHVDLLTRATLFLAMVDGLRRQRAFDPDVDVSTPFRVFLNRFLLPNPLAPAPGDDDRSG